MRDDLIGYLLGAVDHHEATGIDNVLREESASSAGEGPFQRDLALLRLALRPLEADRRPFRAPAGLADRTLRFVRGKAAASSGDVVLTPEQQPVTLVKPRLWLDRVIMGATAIAACVLLAPLLLDAIEEARTRQVERKLGVLAGALHGYADTHRQFPSPPASGPLSRAGLYAPTLVAEHRLVPDDGTVLVPESVLSRSGTHRIPSLEELHDAIGTERLESLVRDMGGDFGYSLGHRDAEGRLRPLPDRRRGHHPLMADAPEDHGLHSDNHSSGLHHVLFEDGRVERIFDPRFGHDGDHLYHNHDGNIAAGVDDEDAAIGGSHHQP